MVSAMVPAMGSTVMLASRAMPAAVRQELGLAELSRYRRRRNYSHNVLYISQESTPAALPGFIQASPSHLWDGFPLITITFIYW